MRQPPSPAAAPPKALLRRVGRAIADFDMIRPGDRILVAVSDGKDSLSLLQILRHLRSYAPVRFELAVLTVDPLVPGFEPGPLRDWYRHLDMHWHYEQQPLLDQAKVHMDGDSFCAWCARMKRGIMYRLCRLHGYNVLALGQHLDDLAESLLLSLFHGGQMRTMKAHYCNDAGDIRVIRPLVYCRERQTRAFAEAAGLPVIADSCPACFSMPTRRAHMKDLLAREEAAHPHLFSSLLQAMRPWLHTAVPPPDLTAADPAALAKVARDAD